MRWWVLIRVWIESVKHICRWLAACFQCYRKYTQSNVLPLAPRPPVRIGPKYVWKVLRVTSQLHVDGVRSSNPVVQPIAFVNILSISDKPSVIFCTRSPWQLPSSIFNVLSPLWTATERTTGKTSQLKENMLRRNCQRFKPRKSIWLGKRKSHAPCLLIVSVERWDSSGLGDLMLGDGNLELLL
jgi:hypothetical protein